MAEAAITVDEVCEKRREKEREKKFSAEDSKLLADIMCLPSKKKDLSYQQLYKHRFTDGITSSDKKALWVEVGELYNKEAQLTRTPEKLEKKWTNLCSTHRLLYANRKRSLTMTGGGPIVKPLGNITNSVINAIGTSSVTVQGVGGYELDSSYDLLKETTNNKSKPKSATSVVNNMYNMLGGDDSFIDSVPTDPASRIQDPASEDQTREELMKLPMEELKRRKLVAQIMFYEKKL